MLTNKIQIIILFLIFSLISSVYFINQPIEFQCDSALFYNYGSGLIQIIKSSFLYKILLLLFSLTLICIFLIIRLKNIKINFENKNIIIYFILIFIIYALVISFFSVKTNFPIADLRRPPIYPIFLILSGTYLFDSLLPIIIFQFVLSFVTIILINEILIINLRSEKIAFIFTLIYSLTSLPYILIKFVIAEQVLLFLSILSFYFLSSYFKHKNNKYLYFSIIVSTIAWLTKWEGFLLFISVASYIIFSFFAFNKKKIYKLLSFFVIPLLILSTWTITRSIVYGDFSKVTSVSNSNSEQFFYKTFGVMNSEIYEFKKKLNLNTDGASIKTIKKDETFLPVIKRTNGENSELLFQTIKNYLTENPESYLPYKKFLAEAYQWDKNNIIDYYYELFGKFNGDPNKIAENIFNQPNIYYFGFINTELDKYIGNFEKNELFKSVIIESFINEPQLLLIFVFDFFEAYGINLTNYFANQSPFSGLGHSDFVNPFNSGKCAENNLTENKFYEYKKSHDNRDRYNILAKLVQYSDLINDKIRDYLSLFLLISLIYLIFYKNFKLYFAYAFFPLTYDFILAMTVDANRNSKYEVISLTCKYILLSILIGYFIQFINRKYNEKKEKNN